MVSGRLEQSVLPLVIGGRFESLVRSLFSSTVDTFISDDVVVSRPPFNEDLEPGVSLWEF
jgi:hypothetical protein